MKRIEFLLAALILTAQLSFAQTVRIPCGLDITAEQSLGLDRPYNFTRPEALAKAPKGYEPVFVEHYGRHGSRYAYSDKFYVTLHDALENGARYGILTEFGEDLRERFAVHYDRYLHRMGDLSPLGQAQQKRIARTMYADFPQAFDTRKGEVDVKASASLSQRSILSMASFCLGLTSVAPAVDICVDNGRVCLDATNPRDKHNPFIVERVSGEFPFATTIDEFQDSRLDPDVVLRRLFTDPRKACEGIGRHKLVRNMYTLVAGMNSIPEEERTDFTGIFTQEEFVRMWEVNNYHCYIEYFKYYPKCLPVVLDIAADADRRLEDGTRGGTFRFGHDHVMMPVFVLLGLNGCTEMAESPDRLPLVARNWESCMATNVQIVFYHSKSSPEVLVRALVNGLDATLNLPGDGPFYRWDDLKAYIQAQTEHYPVKG